jgi:hypothetical protein
LSFSIVLNLNQMAIKCKAMNKWMDKNKEKISELLHFPQWVISLTQLLNREIFIYHFIYLLLVVIIIKYPQCKHKTNKKEAIWQKW